MNRKQFIKILCLTKSFEIAVKNVHWNQSQKANKHKILDDIYSALNDFSDGFAEDGMTCFGEIALHEIIPEVIEYEDGNDLVYKIERFARKCKQIVSEGDEVEFAGLNTVCDDFVHTMKVNLYRYNMN